MAYTPEEIRNIHVKGTALVGKTYISSDGNKYIGVNNGRLEKYRKASTTSTTNIDLSGSNIESNLKDLILRLKQVEVDFGSALHQSYRIFNIKDNDAKIGNKILAEVAYAAPTGKSLDEIEMDEFTVNGNCSDLGIVSLLIKSLNGDLYGKFKINYWIL